jgi:hypothetical protein
MMSISMPSRQFGLSFSGFLIGVFILLAVSLLGMKLIPAYLQNAQITRLFVAIAHDPEMQRASKREIRNSFVKRASIDNITSISAEDIEVDSSAGSLVLSTQYSVKLPLVANVSLCIDFKSVSN